MGLEIDTTEKTRILPDDAGIVVEAETNAPTAPTESDSGYTRVVIRNGAHADWMVMVQGGRTIVDCAQSGRKTVDVPDMLELRFYGGANAADMAAAFTSIGLDLARQVQANRMLLPVESLSAAGIPVDVKHGAFFRPSGEIRLEVMAKTRAGIKRAAAIGTLAAATAAVVHAQGGCVSPGSGPVPQGPGGNSGGISAATTGGVSPTTGSIGSPSGSTGGSTGGSSPSSSSVPPPIGGTTGLTPEAQPASPPADQELVPARSAAAGAPSGPGVQPLVVTHSPDTPAPEIGRATIDVPHPPAAAAHTSPGAPKETRPAAPSPSLPPALPTAGESTPVNHDSRSTVAMAPSGESQAAPSDTSLAAPANPGGQGQRGGRLAHRHSRAPGGLAQTGGDPASYSLFGISLSGIMAALRRGFRRRS